MWNIANILSLLRIVLVIPLIFSIIHDKLGWTIVIFVVAAITDLLDGYFARKLNQVTDYGKILDPLADKIFIGSLAVILILSGRIPFWFFASVLARDLLILAGAYYLKKKTGEVVQSDNIGKLTMVILTLTFFGFIAHIELVMNYGIIVSMVFLIISFSNYSFKTLKLLRNKDK